MKFKRKDRNERICTIDMNLISSVGRELSTVQLRCVPATQWLLLSFVFMFFFSSDFINFYANPHTNLSINLLIQLYDVGIYRFQYSCGRFNANSGTP